MTSIKPHYFFYVRLIRMFLISLLILMGNFGVMTTCFALEAARCSQKADTVDENGKHTLLFTCTPGFLFPTGWELEHEQDLDEPSLVLQDNHAKKIAICIRSKITEVEYKRYKCIPSRND